MVLNFLDILRGLGLDTLEGVWSHNVSYMAKLSAVSSPPDPLPVSRVSAATAVSGKALHEGRGLLRTREVGARVASASDRALR